MQKIIVVLDHIEVEKALALYVQQFLGTDISLLENTINVMLLTNENEPRNLRHFQCVEVKYDLHAVVPPKGIT